MKTSRRFSALCAATLLGVSSPALADDPVAPETADEIAACADRNVTRSATIRKLEFTTKDARGSIQKSRATVHYAQDENGRNRLRMQFDSPTDLRGVGFLLLESKSGGDEMFVYLPEVNSVRRVRGTMMSGSMFGTDFSWRDLESFEHYAEGARRQRLPDARVGDKDCYVIEDDLRGEKDSSYSRIVEYIDKQTCVRMKSELYDRSDKLKKVTTSTLEELSKAGETWYAPIITLRDVQEGTETLVRLEDVKTNVPVHRRRFSVRDLEARGR